MKFTREQFKEMGNLYLDDLPFDDSNEDLMLELFNHLPSDLQGLAVSWGLNDTVFRDDLFEYLLENQFGWSINEYYDYHYEDFNGNIEINFDLLKNND